MLRSEDMTICDVYVQSDAAFENLALLGELECVQFIDMNPGVSPIDRHFVTELCRCADLERTLIMIRNDILKEGVKIPRLRYLADIKPVHPRDMSEFENMLDSVSKDVKDMSANHSNLIKLKSETKEIHYVLNQLDPILGDVERGYTKLPKSMRLRAKGGLSENWQLNIITGVIDRSITHHFRTMLWRISHGTIYYKETPNDEKFVNIATGGDTRKVAFVIVCHGEDMQQRVLKVCKGFNVNLYRWPEIREDRLLTIKELSKRMVEMDKVIQRTKLQLDVTFRNISVQWENWATQIKKAKAIYYNLNLFNFDVTSNTFLGQCWLADRNFNKVESALEQTSAASNARSFIVRTYTEATPPTSYMTTRFSLGFQNVISSYDCGRYKELNPGIFNIILFPFFFGVMFGDVGHGALILVCAAWMINNENKYLPRRSLNDVWNLIFAGRYIILLMGFFSIFMGFMYNEWFSLCAKLMSAFWLNTRDPDEIKSDSLLNLDPKQETGFVYRFGIDPGIKLAFNGILIENTLKMKLAIILGLVHMTFGLLLNICNMVYFKKLYAILFHSVPRLLCLWCIYGWLVYMIYFKWLIKYSDKKKDFRHLWPTLTMEFLDMILWRNTSVPVINRVWANTFNRQIVAQIREEYEKWISVKVLLYHIALACFPFMLLASPIYLFIRYVLSVRRLENSEEFGECQIDEYIKHRKVDTGSLFMHRFIRTIEYGLAAICHMASYLRLWALSMCHSILTRLIWFWTMRHLALSDTSKNGIWKIILVFPMWAALTAFFLVFMDGISIFVHVLRLQWIEFMSKFFKGGGVPFCPFSLVNILDDLDYKYEDDEVDYLCKIRRARASAGDN